jgi:hypothetical protein
MVDTELDSELYNYGVRIGKLWGKELTEIFENIEIPDHPILLKLPIEQLATYKNFSSQTRVMMAMGTENFGVIGNTFISGSAIVTCGISGISMTTTTSPAAKTFYALSCAFSGTSAASSSMAVLARKCEISEVALLTETFGAAFLYLGNQAHAAALKVEGRRVPARYRRPLAGFGLYNGRNNAAFILPFRCSRIIETIPFEQIGRTVGFSISIYFYGRIILSAYRYGQQLIGKSKNKKFLKSTKLFISLICIQSKSTKRRRLYHFVVS